MLKGQKGNDMLVGDGGSDTLIGGHGDDDLFGDWLWAWGEDEFAGDTFVFAANGKGSGHDTIWDFDADERDKIKLSQSWGMDWEDVEAGLTSNEDGDAVINLTHPGGSHNDATVTLFDVAVSDVTEDMFIF